MTALRRRCRTSVDRCPGFDEQQGGTIYRKRASSYTSVSDPRRFTRQAGWDVAATPTRDSREESAG